MKSEPVEAFSAIQRTVDFGQIFELGPTPLAVVEVFPDILVLRAANTKLRQALGVPNLPMDGRLIEDVFLTEATLALSGAVRRVALTGESTQLSLQSLGLDRGSRFEVAVSALDATIPSEFVLLNIEARPDPPPRLSAVTFDQLESLGEGLIFVFDLIRMRARYLPVGLARMLGHDMSQAFDLERVRSLVHPDDFDKMAEYLTGLTPLGGATTSGVTLRVARPEGGWRWLEVRGRALTMGRDGKARTILGVAIDITERRALTRALDRATRAVLLAGEQERHRVARELHDSTAQHLVAIDLGLSSLERRLKLETEAASTARDMRSALTAAHREIRTFSFLLHPPQLRRLGLEATLVRFVEGFGRRSELEIRTVIAGPPVLLTQEVELTLFRVTQEALMNVHRHAQARRATVRLTRSVRFVVVEIDDDGVGISALDELAEERADGVGIPGMRARMAQVGGKLELVRLMPGLRVRAETPL